MARSYEGKVRIGVFYSNLGSGRNTHRVELGLEEKERSKWKG